MLVLSVSRLERSKRPFDFIEVARKVRRQLPDVEFVWVGDGVLRQKVVGSLSDEESGKISFVGYLPEHEKNRLLAAADVYISTSESEGFALTPGEAFLRGVPVVVYDLPVYSEVYDDFPLKARCFDTDDFAKKVILALSKPKWLMEKVSLAREYVRENYSYMGVGVRATRALLEILGAKNSGQP